MSQPAWVRQAQEALKEYTEQTEAQKKAKARALVSMAAKRRDPLGKFLRSKPAQRYSKTGRIMQRVSVPLGIYDCIDAEATDAKIAFSRFIVVLAALGLPVWHDLKEQFFTGACDDIVMPELIRRILNHAVNPAPPRSKRSRVAWQSRVEQALVKPKKPKTQPSDPTAAVLAGLGGGN